MLSTLEEGYAISHYSHGSQSSDSLNVVAFDSDEDRGTKEQEREKLWRERDREIDETGRLETLRHREVLSQATRGGKWDKFNIHHIITASSREDKSSQKGVQRERREDQKASWVPTFRYSSKDKEYERGLPESQTEADQLIRIIGYLTATSLQDYVLLSEVCEKVSANEVNARLAAKGLRREFKYAEPGAQLNAIRLWTVLLQKSPAFMNQAAAKKYLETIEDMLTSQRTPRLVRERLHEALAGAAFLCTSRGYSNGLLSMWRKFKYDTEPDEGLPFRSSDLHLGSESSSDVYVHTRLRKNSPQTNNLPLQGSIVSFDEDVRRLLQECKIGRGNATLLSEALAFAQPKDLTEKDLIKEFYAKCRASQDLISVQIPWASAQAEKSRARPLISGMKKQSTQEEVLLAELLRANEDLMDAFRIYSDIERIGVEDEYNNFADPVESERQNEDDPSFGKDPLLSNSLSDLSSSFSSLSTKSRFVPNILPSSIPDIMLRTEQIDAHTPPSGELYDEHIAAYNSLTPLHNHREVSSRSPSPAVSSRNSKSYSYSISSNSFQDDIDDYAEPLSQPLMHAHTNVGDGEDDSEDDIQTPIEPTAKALGKRRMADGSMISYNAYRPSDESKSVGLESMDTQYGSDVRHFKSSRFIYDAAAERTKRWINEEHELPREQLSRIP